MNRGMVLERAKSAVAERPTQYGTPEDNFERIARLWNAHIGNMPEDVFIESTDVAIMLGLVKIARVEYDPSHLDSWVDLAGYAACGAEVSGAGNPKPDPICERMNQALYGDSPYAFSRQGVGTAARTTGAFGFKIGDLVQFEDAPVGAKPGKVVKFNGDRLLVLFPGEFVPMSCLPNSLRHVPKPESKFGIRSVRR